MHTDEREVVIVGAGPAGLTAAAEFIGSPFRVRVLEEDPEYVGGISRTVRYKECRFDLGGHRFFSKNTEMVNWWRDRLPNDFIKVRRQSRIYYRGQLFEYPLRPLNALRQLGAFTAAQCVLSYGWSQFRPKRPDVTFEDWVSNRFGKMLYHIFFKTYTEKVWGMPCRSISADWASQRIKGLSLRNAITNGLFGRKDGKIKTLVSEFYYPRLGPGMMWEKTRDILSESGIPVTHGHRVVEILHSEGSVRRLATTDRSGLRHEWNVHSTILSMPLRETVLAMSPSAPLEVIQAAKMLEYRDFIMVALIVRGENLFSDNWIYVHDPGVRVGRIQNFNNWSREMVPKAGLTCLGFEYFCSVREDIWSLEDKELAQLAEKEGGTLGLIPTGSVVDSCVVRVPKAYPVYDHTYKSARDIIRRYLQQFSNLQAAGRNGMHKYNNQDHSMMTGILAARKILGHGTFDTWKVNSDAEYLEEETAPSGRLFPNALKIPSAES